ncbi:Peptidyl-prolyl cis-trans isomerase [Aphelenchoides besseyi]|nr:Peptidyl-prolyl cis-trans isomerase [Aphelenchoides besseyi]
MSKSRRRCFFDMTIDGELHTKRLCFRYDDITPETAENFLQLCTGQAGIGKTTRMPLTFKSSCIHRVVKNFMIQGGDFSASNGTGGESIYGGTFDDENFKVKHDQPFILSMANRGPNSNGSQFFITTNACPHLNDVHVAFGRVVQGQDVVTKIEHLKTGPKNRPISDVVISNCGQLIKKGQSGDHEESDEELEVKSRKKKKEKRHKRESSNEEDAKTTKDNNGVNMDNISSVKAEDLPDVPETNNWLSRDRRSPKRDDKRAANNSHRRDYEKRSDRRSRSPRRRRDQNGLKVKGRGRLCYQSPTRERSETPPHWKSEQRRLISITELKDIQKKQRERAEREEALEKERAATTKEPEQRDFGYREPAAFERPAPRNDESSHTNREQRQSPVERRKRPESRDRDSRENRRYSAKETEESRKHQKKDETHRHSKDRRSEDRHSRNYSRDRLSYRSKDRRSNDRSKDYRSRDHSKDRRSNDRSNDHRSNNHRSRDHSKDRRSKDRRSRDRHSKDRRSRDRRSVEKRHQREDQRRRDSDEERQKYRLAGMPKLSEHRREKRERSKHESEQHSPSKRQALDPYANS